MFLENIVFLKKENFSNLRWPLQAERNCRKKANYAQYKYGQDSAETVRRPQAEAPFEHCPDRIIVNLVGIVFV